MSGKGNGRLLKRKNGNGQVKENCPVRCAIYTRKSTDENLDSNFNSLDSQREYSENFIKSQNGNGWTILSDRYDDPAYSGGNMERPALQKLLYNIEAGKIDCVVVYKVDRLSRSLNDFVRIIDMLDKNNIRFCSVTEQFNTSTPMGRLYLNMLSSFSQYERELTAERTRHKMQASRRNGKWVGGIPMLGFDVAPGGGKLIINHEEAQRVKEIYRFYLKHQSLIKTAQDLNRQGWTTKTWVKRDGHIRLGQPFNKTNLYSLLTNMIYLGKFLVTFLAAFWLLFLSRFQQYLR